jgi:hypothetical protein
VKEGACKETEEEEGKENYKKKGGRRNIRKREVE